MKNLTTKLLILLLSIFPQISRAADKDPSAEQIIKNVQKKLENVQIIEAEFLQTFYWSLAEEEEQNSGKIYIGKKDAFRIETSHQLIVSDGKSVWTLSTLEKQVIIDYLDPTEGNYLPHQLFVNYHKDYDVELIGVEIFENKQCYHITLTSQTQDVFIQKLDVWVDKKEWLTRKLTYLDANENITTYIINKITLLTKSNNDLFRFTPDDSFEVVDLR
jgi:chaperone LolA